MTADGAPRVVQVTLPYVHLVRARGRHYAYYRRGEVYIRIKGDIGSFEWRKAYDRLHRDFEHALKRQSTDRRYVAMPGSLEALWMAYTASGDYRRLAAGTRENYDRLMRPIVEHWGHGIVAKLRRTWVQERIDELDQTPRKANHLLALLRMLLNWGMARDWLKDNPARLVKPVRYVKQKHRVWTQAEVDALTVPGSPIAVAILLGLYTGQRLGDVLDIPWSAIEGDVIRLTQHKTGVELVIPLHPMLAKVIKAAPRSDDTIATRPDGARWKVDHFKHVFIAERRRLGLPESVHFHGLRHLAASRLAEAGCSDAQIASITGHKSIAMVQHYSSGARQEKLARDAIERLAANKTS